MSMSDYRRMVPVEQDDHESQLDDNKEEAKQDADNDGKINLEAAPTSNNNNNKQGGGEATGRSQHSDNDDAKSKKS